MLRDTAGGEEAYPSHYRLPVLSTPSVLRPPPLYFAGQNTPPCYGTRQGRRRIPPTKLRRDKTVQSDTFNPLPLLIADEIGGVPAGRGGWKYHIIFDWGGRGIKGESPLIINWAPNIANATNYIKKFTKRVKIQDKHEHSPLIIGWAVLCSVRSLYGEKDNRQDIGNILPVIVIGRKNCFLLTF